MTDTRSNRPGMSYVTARLGTPGKPALALGGGYDPQQWPEEILPEDVRLMSEAGGNLVTVGVFSVGWDDAQATPSVNPLQGSMGSALASGQRTRPPAIAWGCCPRRSSSRERPIGLLNDWLARRVRRIGAVPMDGWLA
jgi:hypothetical protein